MRYLLFCILLRIVVKIYYDLIFFMAPNNIERIWNYKTYYTDKGMISNVRGYGGRVPLSIYPYILGSAVIFFIIICAVGIYWDRNRMYPQDLLLRCLALFLFILEPFLSILHVMNIRYSPVLEKIGVICYGLGTIGYGYEMKNRQKYLKPNCSLTKHEIAVMKGYKTLIIAGIMVILIGIYL